MTLDLDIPGIGAPGPGYATKVNDALAQIATYASAPVEMSRQYVAAWGDDDNDGITPGAAKLTILAAYDALPAGGRIECLGDVTWGGEVEGQGGWFDGSGAALEPGWRAARSVTIVGVGGTAEAQHQFAPGVYVSGHSSTDVTKPVLWFYKCGSFKSLRFENIFATECAQGPVVGTKPDGSSPTSFNLGVEMDNCGFEVVQSPGFGPGFTFDGGTTGNFWMNFTRMFVRGNRTEAIGSDLRAAVVAKGRNYLLYFHDWRTHGGGGMRLYGADRTFFDIRRVLMEGGEAPATEDPPVIETFAGTGSVAGVFEDISSDDAAIAVTADVVIHSTNLPIFITCSRTGKVIGPYRSLDSGTPGVGGSILGGNKPHPATYGSFGLFGTRLIGQTEAGKRLFGAVSARGTNHADYRTNDWGGRSHGTYPDANDATYVHGRRGPHGAATAATIVGTAGKNWSLAEIANTPIALAVDDIVVWGAWVRAASSAGWPAHGFQPSQCVLVTAGFTFESGSKFLRFTQKAPDFDGTDQVWQWIYGYGAVGAIGVNPCTVTVSLNSEFGFDIDAMPGLLAVLPASEGHTLAEAHEYMQHASAWMPGVAQGDVSLLKDQSLVLGGAGGLLAGGGNATPDTKLLRAAAAVWEVTDTFEFPERADPAAPAANKARLYSKDNGAGKTQIVVRFPTGAVQVLATEP